MAPLLIEKRVLIMIAWCLQPCFGGRSCFTPCPSEPKLLLKIWTHSVQHLPIKRTLKISAFESRGLTAKNVGMHLCSFMLAQLRKCMRTFGATQQLTTSVQHSKSNRACHPRLATAAVHIFFLPDASLMPGLPQLLVQGLRPLPRIQIRLAQLCKKVGSSQFYQTTPWITKLEFGR